MNILRPRGMTQAEKDVFAHRQCGLDPNGHELLHMVYVCCPELGDVLPNKQTCGQTPPVFRDRGAENAELNEYPWMVLLLYENRLSLTWNQRTGCAGSLINSRYVLTAAHCVIGGYLTQNDLVLKSVRLGESSTDCITSESRCPHLDVEVGQTTVHHGFTSSGGTYRNDIALLRLQFPVRWVAVISTLISTSYGNFFTNPLDTRNRSNPFVYWTPNFPYRTWIYKSLAGIRLKAVKRWSPARSRKGILLIAWIGIPAFAPRPKYAPVVNGKGTPVRASPAVR